MVRESGSSSARETSSGSEENHYYELKAERYSNVIDYFPLSQEGQDYLAALTKIADALGVDQLTFSSVSSAISRLSAEELSIRRSTLSMHHAEDDLMAHLASTRHEEALILKWTETLKAEPQPDSSIPTLERRKIAFSTKAKEYHEELNALMTQMPEEPPLTVSQLAAHHKQLRNKERELAEKRAKVAAFQGLPPNLDLARHELSNARDEQTKFIQLRERLLDRMASGVS